MLENGSCKLLYSEHRTYSYRQVCRRAPLTIATHATGGVDDRAVNVQMATTTREHDGGNPEYSIKPKLPC